MADRKDPDSPARGGAGKPDFSNVKGGSDTAPDFSNVQGGSDTVPAGSGAQQTYKVEKGDNLSVISKRFYGTSKYWKRIYEANRDTIENPDLIYPGQTLRLPPIDPEHD